jgi:hypothetical protein
MEATGPLTPVSLGTPQIYYSRAPIDITNNAPSQGFLVGKTIVTWTIQDALGSTNASNQNVTVTDTTPPTIAPPKDIVMAATGAFNSISLNIPSVSDIADPNPIVTNNATSLIASGFPPGVQYVLWNATDHSGNHSYATQKISIISNTIDLVNDTSPLWGYPVAVSGHTLGTDSNYTVTVDWGDGSNLSEIPISLTDGEKWGPVTHTYNFTSLTLDSVSLVAKVMSTSTNSEIASSSPVHISVKKHETSLSIQPGAEIKLDQPLTVKGILVDKQTGKGIPERRIVFDRTDGGSLLPVTTSDGQETGAGTGSFAESGSAPSGQSSASGFTINARFRGDTLYLPSTSSFQTGNLTRNDEQENKTNDINGGVSAPASEKVLAITTDRSLYAGNETVTISGNVSQVGNPDKPVQLVVVDPTNSTLAKESLVPNEDGSFQYRLSPSENPAPPGNYRVYGVLGSQDNVTSASTSYMVVSPPIADPGPDIKIQGGFASSVTLDGSKSHDPNNLPLTYSWVQTSGPSVKLSGSNTATPTFTPPNVEKDEIVTFKLVVANGRLSDTKTISAVIVAAKPMSIFGIPINKETIPYLAGGGAAAAAVGTTALYNGGSLLYKLVGRRPKFPILLWDVSAPNGIPWHGTSFIDVVIRNVGESEAKSLTVTASSPSMDIECSLPRLVDTLMPWQSTKCSFKVKHVGSNSDTASVGDHKILLSMATKWNTRQNVVPILSGSQIKWTKKRQKEISVLLVRLNAGLVVIGDIGEHLLPHTSSTRVGKEWHSGYIRDWFEKKGFGLQQVLLSQDTAVTELLKYDSLVLPLTPHAAASLTPHLLETLRQYVNSGRGLAVFGMLSGEGSDYSGEKMHLSETKRQLLEMLGYDVYDPIPILKNMQPFVMRIADSDHPIVRHLNSGDTFRLFGRIDSVAAPRLGSGRKIADELVMPIQRGAAEEARNNSPGYAAWADNRRTLSSNDDQRSDFTLETISAITTREVDAESDQGHGLGKKGRIVHFNFDLDGASPNITGIRGELLERGILWVSNTFQEREQPEG